MGHQDKNFTWEKKLWITMVLTNDQRSLHADKRKYGYTVTNNTVKKTCIKYYHVLKDSLKDRPTVSTLLKSNSRVVRSDPETVGSNTVNKRMSTS